MIALVDGPIDTAAVRAAVARPGAGAIVLFEGVARDNTDGRPVTGLHYEAWPEMALPMMETIAREATARWPEVRVAMAHRTGAVALEEASVVIAASAPHRDEAFVACRYCIDQLKARVPIWMKEHGADGSAWKANAESAEDPREER